MQKKKLLKLFASIFIPLILICSGMAIYMWYHYSNKLNLLEKYTVDGTKEVYVLGTIGKKHFSRINNYSMEDLLSAIENINPDLVMITAREDHYINYNVIDGEIDACVAYSYCRHNDIPIKMVDWWIIDNIYPQMATTNLRDDNIFIKVSRTLREISPNSKILLITNSESFHEQVARFKVAGYRKTDIEDISSYFKQTEEEFHFPPLSSKIWRDRSYFYAYVLPRLIKENTELFDSIKEKYLSTDHDKFYRSQIEYCKYLNNDILYK